MVLGECGHEADDEAALRLHLMLAHDADPDVATSQAHAMALSGAAATAERACVVCREPYPRTSYRVRYCPACQDARCTICKRAGIGRGGAHASTCRRSDGSAPLAVGRPMKATTRVANGDGALLERVRRLVACVEAGDRARVELRAIMGAIPGEIVEPARPCSC